METLVLIILHCFTLDDVEVLTELRLISSQVELAVQMAGALFLGKLQGQHGQFYHYVRLLLMQEMPGLPIRSKIIELLSLRCIRRVRGTKIGTLKPFWMFRTTKCITIKESKRRKLGFSKAEYDGYVKNQWQEVDENSRELLKTAIRSIRGILQFLKDTCDKLYKQNYEPYTNIFNVVIFAGKKENRPILTFFS